MIMVIMGAGASYDSVPSYRPHQPDNPYRPPLAERPVFDRATFRKLLSPIQACHPIVPYLRTPGAETIEQRLQALQSEQEVRPVRFQQIAAIRYYLAMLIRTCEESWRDNTHHGITNHCTLIDQLQYCRGNEPVLLVTFNYDRLIEDGLRSVGVTFTEMNQYINRTDFKLFKLHESINRGREVETAIDMSLDDTKLTQELIKNRANLTISNIYRVVSGTLPCTRYATVHDEKRIEIPLFPAIAIPVEQKGFFECPQDHIEC